MKQLANAEFLNNKDAIVPLENFNLYIKLDEEMKGSEIERINKEKRFLKSEIERSKMILSAPGFREKAPKFKIEVEEEKLNKYLQRLSEIDNDNN